jgi:hypothetical protein
MVSVNRRQRPQPYVLEEQTTKWSRCCSEEQAYSTVCSLALELSGAPGSIQQPRCGGVHASRSALWWLRGGACAWKGMRGRAGGIITTTANTVPSYPGAVVASTFRGYCGLASTRGCLGLDVHEPSDDAGSSGCPIGSAPAERGDRAGDGDTAVGDGVSWVEVRMRSGWPGCRRPWF